LAADNDAFASAPSELRQADVATRRDALLILLDTMRRGLAVTAEALDPATVEEMANATRQGLRDPWSIPQQENPRVAAALIIEAPKRADTGIRGEPLIVRAGPRSSLARRLGRKNLWGRRLDSETYRAVLRSLLAAAEHYGLVRQVSTSFDVDGWHLAANAVRLVAANGDPDKGPSNSYFTDLYRTLANALAQGGTGLFGLEGRAHTAQVEQTQREWREWRFRWGQDDQRKIKESKDEMRQAGEQGVFLPVLFCSPTMELGVDISALNAVYMRNVPPTPANYAQRSGRAGRSGQAALAVTYCAAQSPHDQYYFQRPAQMVSGYVRPPAIELANRDLIEAHLHAVWLAETGKELSTDIPHVLDLQKEGLPVQKEIVEALNEPQMLASAAASMQRILASVEAELTPEAAPWATNRTDFAAKPRLRLRNVFLTRSTVGASFTRVPEPNSSRQIASQKPTVYLPPNGERPRFSKRRQMSSWPYLNVEAIPPDRISIRIGIWQLKDFFQDIIFRDCLCMRMFPQSVVVDQRPSICNERDSSRSPSLGLAPLYIMKVAPTGSTKPSFRRAFGMKRAGDW
jgi:hypothetical protein